jgi:hypothetical protein
VSSQCWHLTTGLCSMGSMSLGILQGRASDLPTGSAHCVPMAIWRFVVRALHRRPTNARVTRSGGRSVSIEWLVPIPAH